MGRDRGGQEGGLRVHGAGRARRRDHPRRVAKRLAEGLVGLAPDAPRPGRDVRKAPAHAHRLRALAGKDEREAPRADSSAAMGARDARCAGTRRDAARPHAPVAALRRAERASCAIMHTMDDPLLSPVVQAARDELQNPRMLSDRIAVGRALWRELVIGFAQQLGELDLGFTQLAALYAAAGPGR